MATVVSVPMAQQLQVPFIMMRDIYEVRERPSRMYSWTAFVTSQILAELPWNIFGSSIFFVCWYWTVGYSSDTARAGYAYLFIGVIFPLYYTTVGQVRYVTHRCVRIRLNFPFFCRLLRRCPPTPKYLRCYSARSFRLC